MRSVAIIKNCLELLLLLGEADVVVGEFDVLLSSRGGSRLIPRPIS